MPPRFLTASRSRVLFAEHDIFITRFSLAWSTSLTDCAVQSGREHLMKARQMVQDIPPGLFWGEGETSGAILHPLQIG